MRVIRERSSEAEAALQGFTDNHLQFLDFFLKKELGLRYLAYEVDVASTPRRVTIRVFDANRKEVIFRHKDLTILPKMVQFMNLSNWELAFASSMKGDL